MGGERVADSSVDRALDRDVDCSVGVPCAATSDRALAVEITNEARAVELLSRLRRLDANESDARFYPAATDIATDLATLLAETDAASAIDAPLVRTVERTSESARVKAALVLGAGRSGRASLTRWVAEILIDPLADPLLRRAAVLGIGPITNPSARRMYTVGEFVKERGRPLHTFRAVFARGPLDDEKKSLFRDVAQYDDDLVLSELCVLALGQAIDHDTGVLQLCLSLLELHARTRDRLWTALVFVLSHGQDPTLLTELSMRLDSMRADAAADAARADILVALADHQISHATLPLLLEATGDARLSHRSRARLMSHLLPVLEDGRFEIGPWRAMVREQAAELDFTETPGL